VQQLDGDTPETGLRTHGRIEAEIELGLDGRISDRLPVTRSSGRPEDRVTATVAPQLSPPCLDSRQLANQVEILRQIQRDQIKIPTTHAAISEAMAPPTIASRAILDRSARRLGAMVLIPPTWMPMLAKLAKPHNA